jgi:hypothetical protein
MERPDFEKIKDPAKFADELATYLFDFGITNGTESFNNGSRWTSGKTRGQTRGPQAGSGRPLLFQASRKVASRARLSEHPNACPALLILCVLAKGQKQRDNICTK